MASRHRSKAITSDVAVVSKAALRAADRLKLTNKALAQIIGVSEATVSRMKRGEYHLEGGQKPFELAILFVRMFRSLDAMVGGDDNVAAAWLINRNIVLQDAPIALIRSVSGLANVIQYLDARRAVV